MNTAVRPVLPFRPSRLFTYGSFAIMGLLWSAFAVALIASQQTRRAGSSWRGRAAAC